jgi:hypothetical protein
MALGDDDVIGGDDGSPEVTALSTAAVTDAHPGSSRHFRHIRLWPRREALGRPRMSTFMLMGVWIAVLALYLEVRPI